MNHKEKIELKREIRTLKKSKLSKETVINILKSYGFNEEAIERYWK